MRQLTSRLINAGFVSVLALLCAATSSFAQNTTTTGQNQPAQQTQSFSDRAALIILLEFNDGEVESVTLVPRVLRCTSVQDNGICTTWTPTSEIRNAEFSDLFGELPSSRLWLVATKNAPSNLLNESGLDQELLTHAFCEVAQNYATDNHNHAVVVAASQICSNQTDEEFPADDGLTISRN